MDLNYLTERGTIVVNEVTVGEADGPRVDAVRPQRSVEATALAVDFGGQHRSPAVLLSPALAERMGIERGGFQVVAAYDEPLAVNAQDAIRRDAAALSTPAVYTDARWEPGPTDASPWLALVVAATAVLAIGASAIALGLARVERRPDDATLAAVGGSRMLRRNIAGWQAAIVAGVGMLTGVAAGILPVWGVSLAAQGTYNPAQFSDMPWPWLAALAVGLPVAIALASWLVPPRHPDLTRRTAIA